MHQPANLPFERVVHEFARWRAVPERDRSPAPAWWWGPAFEALGLRQPMPAEWCAGLGLPDGSPIATGAEAAARIARRPDLAAMDRRFSVQRKAFEFAVTPVSNASSVGRP